MLKAWADDVQVMDMLELLCKLYRAQKNEHQH
jgi:hypothetical protein